MSASAYGYFSVSIFLDFLYACLSRSDFGRFDFGAFFVVGFCQSHFGEVDSGVTAARLKVAKFALWNSQVVRLECLTRRGALHPLKEVGPPPLIWPHPA